MSLQEPLALSELGVLPLTLGTYARFGMGIAIGYTTVPIITLIFIREIGICMGIEKESAPLRWVRGRFHQQVGLLG